MALDNFDKYTENYNSNLDDSLKFTGVNHDYFCRYKVKKLYNYLKKINHKIEELRILDFGCGVGNHIGHLKNAFTESELYGVDISKQSLNVAKSKFSDFCKFDLFDGFNLPYEKDFFDVIFISNVLHHIQSKDHQQVLKSLQNILKRGGILFIVEHNPFNPLTSQFFKNCALDIDAEMIRPRYLKRHLESLNYKCIDINFIVFLPPKIKFLLFLEKYLTSLPLGAQYFCSALKN